MDKLDLHGLDLAPAQVFGNVRLVPLLRRTVREDLRLARRRYDEPIGVVSLKGKLLAASETYTSFVPHGLVVSWGSEGTMASFGASLAATGKPRDGKSFGGCVRLLHRMVRREEDNTLRFLPLHLAMEGFLALCFNGPDIAWSEYSQRAVRTGLSPRTERSVRGAALPGFADALRLFEIHEGQVGVLVFIADALASAFVVPHPEDYRALHASLIEDFYGELLYRYGYLYPEAPAAMSSIDAARVHTLEDLRAALAGVRREWAEFATILASGAIGRALRSEVVYTMDRFRLVRFIPELRLDEENHIGEAIVRDDGAVEYLKTYRLTDAQTRRAHLLQMLSKHGFSLSATAAALGSSEVELCRRLDNAGFGYLLAPAVLAAARAPH
ncbi:Hypothetical protein A7982_05455 [Minicystis rosea]|nr:Hypothetical protein A7982_05455 [Minicystis rosea]